MTRRQDGEHSKHSVQSRQFQSSAIHLLVAVKFAQKKKMKKRVSSREASPTRGYTGTGVSAEVKEHTAEFVAALLDAGVKMETIVGALGKTSYAPKKRTLYKLVGQVRAGDPVVSPHKESGNKSMLTDEEKMIVAGWILVQEKKVELWHVQQWVRANFKQNPSISTVSRWKDELGLSIRLVNKRPMSETTTKDEYVLGYFEFLQQLRATDFWNFDRSRIICLDSVTNSMRADREKTITLSGGQQKKFSRNTPKYTNNYLVCVALESGLEFDTLMFTHDPQFDSKGPGWPKVEKWCAKLGIRTDQIFYEESTKKYCAEKAWQVSQFMNRNRAKLAGTRVLHDAGPAFKFKGEYILGDGADRLVVFPPDQHGQLSPLDNKLNAVAKTLWRAERKMEDFSWDALLLLQKLESVGQESITSWWTHNFLLDVRKLSVKAVEERLSQIRKRPPIRQALADKYMDAYEAWLEEHIEMPLERPPEELYIDLDGDFWKK